MTRDETDWVTVRPGFAVARFPVTVEEYRRFIDAGGYRRDEFWSDRGLAWRCQVQPAHPAYWDEEGYRAPRLPVTGVSYWEAEAYAAFRDSRLPTDREWEYFASNGVGDPYPWGADRPTPERSNLAFWRQNNRHGSRRSVDAAPKGRSKTGVHDLIGNTSEWTSSERTSSEEGVLKGGCVWHHPLAVSNASEDVVIREIRDNQTGIRLVRGAVPEEELDDLQVGSAVPGAQGLALKRPIAPFRQEGPPPMDVYHDWRLRVFGEVENPLEFDLQELHREFDSRTSDGLFVCVCRWGSVDQIRGVPLRAIVDRVAPTAPIDDLFLIQRSLPGKDGLVYDSCLPLQSALDQETILGFELNGRTLSRTLGGPLRLYNFSLYGYKQVKALAELEIARQPIVGYWETKCGYDQDGLIRPGEITVVGPNSRPLKIETYGRVEGFDGTSPEARSADAAVAPPGEGDL